MPCSTPLLKRSNGLMARCEAFASRAEDKGIAPPNFSCQRLRLRPLVANLQGYSRIGSVLQLAGPIVVCRLLNVPATCWCISGTGLRGHCSCYHTEMELADQTCDLTQVQYTDRSTGPNTDLVRPGTRHDSNCSSKFEVTGTRAPGKTRSDP